MKIFLVELTEGEVEPLSLGSARSIGMVGLSAKGAETPGLYLGCHEARRGRAEEPRGPGQVWHS